ARAPWIDLNDLRARGAVVVWTAGDPHVIPPELRTIAADAALQPPFTLPYRRGPGEVTVGWAILLPRPSFALSTVMPGLDPRLSGLIFVDVAHGVDSSVF
ncbi:MAG: hypothetical protein ACLQJR_15625, partial [Stellaceae bacterium]